MRKIRSGLGGMALALAIVVGSSVARAGDDNAAEEPAEAPTKTEAKQTAPGDKPAADRPAGDDDKEPPAPEPPIDPKRQQARELFIQGSELVKRSQWAEGLKAFEKSAKLRPHAVTQYNMAACLRATGRYVEAREALSLALSHHRAEGNGKLNDRLLDVTRTYLDELEGIVVRLDVTLAPANAAIAVDGRPLEQVGKRRGRPVMLAGTLPAGRGRQAPSKRFDVVLDPGAHVVTLSRKGFGDAVVNRSFKAGTHDKLDLKIEQLDAKLVIGASEDAAVVTVDGRDVGFAPVELSRPGGAYVVTVEKEGYAPFETTATVDPGAVWRVHADMPTQMPPLYKRWWFWTTLVGSAATIAVTTYVITMPEPERPAANCGGLGWCIEVD